METKSLPRFVWKTTVVHAVTYFLVGLLAFTLLDYTTAWSDPAVDMLLRPTDHPLVAAGPLFQFIRGPLFALVLYPFYDVLFGKKRGWLYMWGLFVIFAGINPIDAGAGSIEGVLYTTLPTWFHLIGIPEVLIQTLLFSVVLYAWVNRPDKRWISIVLYVLLFFAVLFPIMGLLFGGAV
jgi:hypothetical protein